MKILSGIAQSFNDHFNNPKFSRILNQSNLVVIVIPVHNFIPTAFETISIQQCLSVLSQYPIVIFGRTNFDFTHYKSLCIHYSQVQFVTFDYGEGVEGFNKLLTSSSFYQFFLSYKYMLIHHTDAFIFRDELYAWCQKDFNYIGATPYVNYDYVIQSRMGRSRLFKFLYRMKLINKVYYGVGGLSLRKVYPFFINSLLFKRKKNVPEDCFWFFVIATRNPFFRLPSFSEASLFAYNDEPQKQYEDNNQQLPFGCHSWHKYAFTFWKPLIEQYGYELKS